MKLDELPRVVMVASGKGGVGKTTVASDLARSASDMGYSVGLIDGDISTPNSPEVVGGESVDLDGQRLTTGDSIVPTVVDHIQLISQGVVLPDDVPVLRDGAWRAEAVADYIGHVEWQENTDLVVIDTPPGTGEELQTFLSEAPPDRAFLVTTPHPSAVRDVTKTHELMAQAGVDQDVVVNMAYLPAADMAEYLLGPADFTQIEQVGDSRAKEIQQLVHQSARDFPLFGYENSVQIPFDTRSGEPVAMVPYTPQYEARRSVYEPVVQDVMAEHEVKA